MIKRLKLLLPLLLIQLVCLSSTDTIYNGAIVRTETNVFYVFDSVTVDGIVKDAIRLDECKETQDSLKSIIKDLDFTSETKSKVIRVQEGIISDTEEQNVILDELLDIKHKKIQKLEKRNTWNKIGLYVVGGVAILEAAALTTIILLK